MKKALIIAVAALMAAALVFAAGCVSSDPILGTWQEADGIGTSELLFENDGTGTITEYVFSNEMIYEEFTDPASAFQRTNTWGITWKKTGDSLYLIDDDVDEGEILFNDDGTGSYTSKLADLMWDFTWEIIDEENEYRLFYPETNTLEEVIFNDDGTGSFTSSSSMEFWNYHWEKQGDNQYFLQYPDNTQELFTFNDGGVGTSVYTKNDIPETWEIAWIKPMESTYILMYSDGETHMVSFKDDGTGILILFIHTEPVKQLDYSMGFVWTDNGDGSYQLVYEDEVEETGTLDAAKGIFTLTDVITGVQYQYLKE